MDFVTTVSGNEPIAITIGNFDGIHRGHQRLLHELGAVARSLGCKPVMVTFSPHTLLVVRPAIQLDCLTTLEEKLALAKEYGQVADNIVIHFTQEVAAMTASAFLDELRAHFRIQAMVIGNNFSLGHNRMGDVAFLQQYGQDHQILILPVELEAVERTRISSTRIRSYVSEGQITAANELLGHPVVASGIVVKGDQRGRLLGFPTANLLPEAHKLLPANGVYAALVYTDNARESDAIDQIPVSYDDQQNRWNSVVNIGVRPTFGGQQETGRLVEAHLLDVQLDLYDQRITINFISRLRNEQRFNGIDALKAQIAADAQQARLLLQKGG
ncbi:MAG TPA: bifunctional riboflavin kinase/FAD synthetase [Ktedonobacteraceae bacterium]|nr:bifunctional riboflavin kinase/FAD synthetase [Ktedonobacteraceae bacterium]